MTVRNLSWVILSQGKNVFGSIEPLQGCKENISRQQQGIVPILFSCCFSAMTKDGTSLAICDHSSPNVGSNGFCEVQLIVSMSSVGIRACNKWWAQCKLTVLWHWYNFFHMGGPITLLGVYSQGASRSGFDVYACLCGGQEPRFDVHWAFGSLGNVTCRRCRAETTYDQIWSISYIFFTNLY